MKRRIRLKGYEFKKMMIKKEDKKTWKEKGKRQKIKIRGKNRKWRRWNGDGDGEDGMDMMMDKE